MNQSWQIGDTRITRIEELTGPLFDPTRFFPDYQVEVFEKHRHWLYPNHCDEASGRIIASMHSWLIQTPHHNILVDGCIGDDKERMPYRNWHRMQTPWLANFTAAGVAPEDIDFILCTHLHVDHVGWNTRLVNGEWVPTFPNARYVISETELRFWQEQHASASADDAFASVNKQTFEDSVQPILGQSQLIIRDEDLIGDRLFIAITPGHTPGSVTLRLSADQDRAYFCGDICHHPIQVYEPHWNSAYCELPEQAIHTRRQLLETCASENALLMPAHFGPSHAGLVQRRGEGFSFLWESSQPA
jgi:glyoxylase-like metal-dependent hydrolase (beta-lactamase superfamily II)